MENYDMQDAQPQQQEQEQQQPPPPQQPPPVVEEAQAAPKQAADSAPAATSEIHDEPGIPHQQEQGIAVGEPDPSSPGVAPVSEEGLNPAEIPDPAVTMTSDDLVGSDPKVTMNPEDLSGPESSENPSDFLAGDDTHSYIELGDPDFTSERGDAGWISDVLPVSEDEWLDIWNVEDDDSTSIGLDIDGQVKDYADDWSWGSGPSDAEEIVSEDPAPGGYHDMLGISKEDIEGPSSDTDGDGASDLDETREDAAPGGYDGSGIAGGLDLDQDGVFDRIENNLDVSDGGGYTYDEGAYEDAEDAFEDLQDALQDGDEEDLAEALEELQGYLGSFDKGAGEEAKDASGDDYDGGHHLVEEGISLGDIVGEENAKEGRHESLDEEKAQDAALGDLTGTDYREILDDLDSGNLDDVREFLEDLAGGGNDEEEAQEAPGGHEHGHHLAEEGISLGDIAGEGNAKGGLHGDNDTEEQQDALGKFTDVDFEELQDSLAKGDFEGTREVLDDLSDVNFDELKDALGGHADGEEIKDALSTLADGDFNKVQEALGDAVGANLGEPGGEALKHLADGDLDGALGVGAGLAGEAIDEALGIDGAGKVLGDVVDGDFDEAIDGAAGLAGGAIDDALGIEGSGEAISGVLDGDWDKVADSLPDLVESGVEKVFGIEGAGDALEDLLEGDWDELGDHIGEAAGSFVGNMLGGPVGAEIGEKVGEFVGDGVGDAVTEELGDIADHIENGEYDEIAGDVLALNAGAVGGLIFGEHGAAVGQEIGEAVGDAASEVVEEVGEVVEDVGEAIGDAGEAVADFFGF